MRCIKSNKVSNRFIRNFLLVGSFIYMVVMLISVLFYNTRPLEAENFELKVSTQSEIIEPISSNIQVSDICDTTSPNVEIETSDLKDIDIQSKTLDIEAVESEDPADVSNQFYIDISPNEVHELAALVTLEGGGESYECMKGIVSVVINRSLSKSMSVHDVIYEPNQFDVVADVSSTTGSDLAYMAVEEVLTYGPIFPLNVTYFRAHRYHSWSKAIVPYLNIDNTYFSVDTTLEVN